MTLGIAFVGLLVLIAAAIGTAKWAVRNTDLGTYYYARYLNRRHPLDRGWRQPWDH